MGCCGFHIPGMSDCACGGSCACSQTPESSLSEALEAIPADGGEHGGEYSLFGGGVPGFGKGGGAIYSSTGGGIPGYSGAAGGSSYPPWTGAAGIGGTPPACWRGPVGVGGAGLIPGTPILSAACGDPYAPAGVGGGPIPWNGSPDVSSRLDPTTRFIPIGPFYGGGSGGGAGTGGGGGGGVAG